jgi:hypothetical protein
VIEFRFQYRVILKNGREEARYTNSYRSAPVLALGFGGLTG